MVVGTTNTMGRNHQNNLKSNHENNAFYIVSFWCNKSGGKRNSSYSLHLSHDDSFVKILYINIIEAVCLLHHIQIRQSCMCVCVGVTV